MSTAGSPTTVSGNGSQRYSVTASTLYARLRAELESDYPRLCDIFHAVEGQFSVLPRNNATHLSGDTWLHQTLEGLGAPSLLIYFEIFEQPHRSVRLQAVHAPE